MAKIFDIKTGKLIAEFNPEPPAKPENAETGLRMSAMEVFKDKLTNFISRDNDWSDNEPA